MSHPFTLVPMVDASDLPIEVAGYCREQGYPIHYGRAVIGVDLDVPNPLWSWLEEQGYRFDEEEYYRGWGHIGLCGS